MYHYEPYKVVWDYFENYYKVCDLFAKRGAVYGLTFSENRPEEYELPSMLKDTVYIGRSSGRYVDKQGGKKTKMRSYVHKRMTQHHKPLSTGIAKSKGFQLIIDEYGYGENMMRGTMTNKPLWLCLMIPSPKISDEQVARWTTYYEMYELMRYNDSFKEDPLGNMDCAPRKDPNSFSSIRLKELEENSLEKFARGG